MYKTAAIFTIAGILSLIAGFYITATLPGGIGKGIGLGLYVIGTIEMLLAVAIIVCEK